MSNKIQIGLMLLFFCFNVNANALLNPPFKVASIEFNPEFMAFETNLPKLFTVTEDAAKNGAQLIVLPEMATCGYIYKDRQQIEPFLDTIPGKTTANLESIAKQYNTYIVIGIGEIDPISKLAYNSAAIIGPHGYIGKYRKIGLNSDDAKWAVRGNLGVPVFDTLLGKIALLICYDDSYIQSFLLSSLRGANIIAYLTASDRLPLDEAGSQFNHSTIANVATLSGWIGTYIVGSSRTGIEKNPITNRSTYYVGGASIWSPTGKNLAQAQASSLENPLPGQTIYAMIDPALYQNKAKQILEERRKPRLYQVMNLYRAPIDPEASVASQHINAMLLQYTPIPGNKKANLEKINSLLQASNASSVNFIVLPENSLIGGLTGSALLPHAESLQGESFHQLSELAKKYHSFLAFTMPEKDENTYYSSAILLNDKGEIVGHYRKAHLNTTEQSWAKAGDDLPVFATSLGRIAFIIGDEVQVPDISNVLAMKRADIIIIPTAWAGEYGTAVNVDPGLLIKPYPSNTMTHWYNVAKYSQAYTLVANYVGGSWKGSSAMYSLDPVQDHYVPLVASLQDEIAFPVSFDTLGPMNWWMNQTYLITGQQVALNAPLTLDYTSTCFIQWKKDSTGNNFCWNH